MGPATQTSAPLSRWAVIGIALAETIQFMVSTTEVVSPSSLYVGLAAKIIVLVLTYLRPFWLDQLCRIRIAVPYAVAFTLSIVCVYSCPHGIAAFGASLVFYGCEMVAVLMAGRVLFNEVSVGSIAFAVLKGILIAFCAALVLFSLPINISIVLQVLITASCGLFPWTCCRFCKPTDKAAFSRTTAHIPPELGFALAFFACGIQVSYLNFWSGCDWSASFAFAVVISLVLLIVEFYLVRPTRISFMDLTSAAMLSIPAVYAGAGIGDPSILVALSSIGFYLFLPRVFQVVAKTGTDRHADPIRLLAEAEIVLSMAEVIATVALGASQFDRLSPTVHLTVAVVVATGCILSAFALYETRTRAIIYDFIEDEPRLTEEDIVVPSGTAALAPSADACGAVAQEYALTDREKEILVLLAQGLTLARLCEAANISMATAKSHVYHIYQKMDVHSRKELAAVVMATRIEQASADGPTHPQKVDCG